MLFRLNENQGGWWLNLTPKTHEESAQLVRLKLDEVKAPPTLVVGRRQQQRVYIR